MSRKSQLLFSFTLILATTTFGIQALAQNYLDKIQIYPEGNFDGYGPKPLIAACSSEENQNGLCEIEYLGGLVQVENSKSVKSLGLTCIEWNETKDECLDPRVVYNTPTGVSYISIVKVNSKAKYNPDYTADNNDTALASNLFFSYWGAYLAFGDRDDCCFIGGIDNPGEVAKTIVVMPIAFGLDIIKAPIFIPGSLIYILGNSIKGTVAQNKFRAQLKKILKFMSNPQNIGEILTLDSKIKKEQRIINTFSETTWNWKYRYENTEVNK